MRKLFFKSMLLLCALIVGSGNVWGDTYSKVTPAPSDWSGTYIIIADASNVVFTGKDGSNSYGGHASVTITDGAVTGDFSSYEVLIEKSGNVYTIKHISSGNYLGWSSGNTLDFNTSTPSTNAYKWSLDIDEILNASNVSRKLQYNSSSPRFACYTSSQKVASLYKKEEVTPVTTLSVKTAPTKTKYEVGEALDMTGFVLNADGEDVSKGYTMSIGGDEIENGATLNSAGKKTITVSYGGKEVSQNISVGSVTSIAVTTPPTKTSYDTGDSFDPTGMVVTASLSTGELSEPDTWTKNVTSYTIEPENDLAPANTSVTITYSSKSTTQAITVENVAVSIVSLKASTTIEKEKTETLIPVFTPANATNKNVTWESDDEDVAAVSDAGVVTAIAAGTANITVTTEDGGKTATCVVTVVDQKGTIDAPFSVADVIGDATGSDVYVMGYIVGSYKSGSKSNFGRNGDSNTNLAIADDPDENSGANTVAVQLPSGVIRDNFNVSSNAQYIGTAKVIVKADITSYITDKGLKNTEEIVKVSEIVKVGSTGYATWSSNCAHDFTGITSINAYTVSGLEANGYTLTLSQVTGTICANTGLLISAGNGSSAEVPVAENGSTPATNLLVGKTSNFAITTSTPNYANFYVMVANGDKAEFRNIKTYVEASNTVTIKAGKAYLDLTSVSAAPSIIRIVDEENNATSINDIEASDKAVKFLENGQIYILRDGVVYDALGRIIR